MIVQYFMDKQHQKNYKHLTTMVFRNALNEPEYHVAAYILAIPDIYEKCNQDPLLYEYPFLWTVQYIDKSYTEFDQEYNEEYYIVSIEYVKDEKGNILFSKEFSTLPTSLKQIIKLGRNLFNSNYKDFNLMDALGTWGDTFFKIYHQAVLIRINREVKGLK